MVFAVDGKAMHGTTQSNGRSPDIVDLIRGNGHDYFIALKANQKEVRWSVEDELPKMVPDEEFRSDVECGHGRIHERICRVYHDLSRINGIGKLFSFSSFLQR